MIIRFNYGRMDNINGEVMSSYFDRMQKFACSCQRDIEQFKDNWTDFRGRNFVNVYESSYDTFLTNNLKALESSIDFVKNASNKYREAEEQVTNLFKF